MKKQKTLWNGSAMLIVAVLVTMAFVPKSWQIWIYAGVFAIWAIWAGRKFLIPYLRECKCSADTRREKKRYEKRQAGKPFSADMSPVYDMLLRHANYRITTFLKSSYPDATWTWCEEYPETIVAEGGKGRIQVFGIDEYNYGEVTFEKNANMKCSLLKVVPLGAEGKNGSKDGASKNPNPPQNPVDPQIWFEQQGKDVLEKLIADLNAYGHRRLVIRENGDVTVMQADKEITKCHFATVPEKMYWNRLAKVLERSGVASEVQEDGIVVTW